MDIFEFYLYIKNTFSLAGFVCTNSIVQGEQVEMLWRTIFSNNVDIVFAYPSFKWTNNAKYQAGVTCVIIGIKNKNNNRRKNR